MQVPRWDQESKLLTASRKFINISVACVAIVGVLLTLLYSYSSAPTDRTSTTPSTSHSEASSRQSEIPNIIHYTQLKKSPDSVLKFSFESFLSLYSAVLFLSPTTIYIHTDHNASAIETAKSSGSKWTQKVLNTFPEIVKINEVVAPSVVNDINVHIEAKSDFVRWEILYEYGGLYIDWDVLPLRDIRSLRKAGYRSVVGRQVDGSVNPGCVMTSAGSVLAELMRREGPKIFDGSWERHSVSLCTAVCERIAGTPDEILILDRYAMAPTAWYPDTVDNLFKPHNGTDDSTNIQIEDQLTDPMERWSTRVGDRGWKQDFGMTYLLHAFKARGHEVPYFKEITVPYILAQNSNFAFAAGPAVNHMLEHKIITEEDTLPIFDPFSDDSQH